MRPHGSCKPRTDPNVPCLDVRGLSKNYGDTKAVDGVTFSVRRGQVFGFLGPNGAGKSTTIKMLTTLVRPTSGSASVSGIDLTKRPLEVRRRIGVVQQQPSYEPVLSVEKSLDKYGVMWNVPKDVRRSRIELLLRDFDLADIRKKRNEDLSIGQRRRVQVAREFMHDMELLFLDEPTVGMDTGSRRKLLDYLKGKVADGLTIFYTTHVLSEAEYLCDQVAMINKGRILAIDAPESFKNKFGGKKTVRLHAAEAHENVQALLAGLPNCDVFVDGSDIMIRFDGWGDVLRRALDILDKNGIKIDDMSVSKASLEDVFLEMMA